jgi:hypothetical protein
MKDRALPSNHHAPPVMAGRPSALCLGERGRDVDGGAKSRHDDEGAPLTTHVMTGDTEWV